MHGIHVRKGSSWAMRPVPGIWQLWQQLPSLLSLCVRHLEPEQVPSAGLPCNTLSFKFCSKSSVCGLLSPGPVAPVLSHITEFLYFIQEMEMGDIELQLFAIPNYYWEEWAPVVFCNCVHPVSLPSHCTFHSAKYVCFYELHNVKYGMFFLPRKVK